MKKIKCPKNHQPFTSAALAKRIMRDMIERDKRNGEQSWLKLNVFQCEKQHWHIGRSHLRKPKGITEKNYASAYALAPLGFVTDLTAAARVAKEAVDELNDSLMLANRLADRYFPAPPQNGKRS
jgi:hypothetical protein